MKRLVPMAWLTTLWVLLWRDISVANVASGIVVSLAVNVAQPGAWRVPERNTVRPLRTLAFLGYFGWKLVQSNLVIAREVVTPRNHIETGVIEVQLQSCSDLVVTIVANVLSLTPGTLTLEVRRVDVPTLYVHVLHLHDIESARADVETMARMAQAAFPLRSTT